MFSVLCCKAYHLWGCDLSTSEYPIIVPKKEKCVYCIVLKKIHVACEIKRFCFNYKDDKLVMRPMAIFQFTYIHH